MTFTEKCALSDRLEAAEKSARADFQELFAKADIFTRLAVEIRQQHNLLADARYKLWEQED